jgi:hypothetical protein
MATRWAPGTKTYASMLQMVADRFHEEVCKAPDPRPGLVQEARAQSVKTPPAGPPAVKTADDAEQRRPTGRELAQQAIEQAKTDGNDRRSALGAQTAAEAVAASAAPPAPFKVLNVPTAEAPNPPVETPAAKTVADLKATVADAKATLAPAATAKAAPAEKAMPAEKAPTRTALAAPAAKGKTIIDTATPPAANQKCRVWTASYGGQKAMIIRSVIDQVVNFTVLDVNEGSETREAEAFISAYARNGRIAGEYTNQAQALDKAFELCPEG